MARIPLLREDDESTPEAARAVLMGARSSRGRLVNLYRALANHPAALQGFSALGSAVYGRDTTLTRKQAELAYTTATVVNACYY
ncbi:MAG: carboxymuconolactone decarboxylase family protein, partial [Tepidiformaceae bacterium]